MIPKFYDYNVIKHTAVHGTLHSLNDEPAIVTDHVKIWYKDGIVHREKGPAIDGDGYKVYVLNGRITNMYGPSIIIKNGNDEKKFYSINSTFIIPDYFGFRSFEIMCDIEKKYGSKNSNNSNDNSSINKLVNNPLYDNNINIIIRNFMIGKSINGLMFRKQALD